MSKEELVIALTFDALRSGHLPADSIAFYVTDLVRDLERRGVDFSGVDLKNIPPFVVKSSSHSEEK